MINKDFELERLRDTLRARGLDQRTVDTIVEKARSEIEQAMAQKVTEAMSTAIDSGVDKGSADFINELRPAPNAFQLETESGNTDFSTPPYPMLARLLKNPKPLADGSGVYKIIPIGSSNKPKPRISDNIFDTQKAVQTQRAEAAKRQYNKVAPAGSKAQFRTVTSKQSEESWIMPAKEMNFADELSTLNKSLDKDLEDVVLGVIRDYVENF